MLYNEIGKQEIRTFLVNFDSFFIHTLRVLEYIYILVLENHLLCEIERTTCRTQFIYRYSM